MLAALTEDFAAIDGIEVTTLLASGFDTTGFSPAIRVVLSDTHEPRTFRDVVRESDWAVIIAPEFDRILLERCEWVVGNGGRLLGPSPATVALAADKLRICRALSGDGVPTPPTWDASSRSIPVINGPIICKPRFGAGSINTRRFETIGPELYEYLDSESGRQMPMILQPWLPGIAASVAFISASNVAIPLCPAHQRISSDGRYTYLGGSLPLPRDFAMRAEAIAKKAIAVLTGVTGYVGVDLILGDDGNDWVIEVNPRLTTSYLGLRRLTRENLAQGMLDVATGTRMAPVEWILGKVVEFDASGTIRETQIVA
jgi:predicted ATP-grasp superfamily ATP-dependent carboligase